MSSSSLTRTMEQRAFEALQRRRIAETTCRLVAENGLEGASLRRVARELGSTTGMVTHYFPTKAALLEVALQTALANLARSFPADYRAAESMDEWVEHFLAARPTDETRRTFWRVLTVFQSASLTTPRLAEVARSYADSSKPELARLVAAALPAQSPDRAEELTEVLWLVVDGIGITVALHGDRINEDMVRRTLRGAWRGLLGVDGTETTDLTQEGE